MSTATPMSDNIRSLGEIFGEIPAGPRSLMTRGLRIIGSLTNQKIATLSSILTESVDSLGELDTEDASRSLGMTADEAGTVISASSLLIYLTSSRDETSQAIEVELIKAGLLRDADRSAVAELLSHLSNDKENIKKSFDISELASSTLPSFRHLSTSLDLRFRFEQNTIDLTVPVIVASLQTDDGLSNTFFQMKPSDVVRLADQFTKLKVQIEAVEAWVSNKK